MRSVLVVCLLAGAAVLPATRASTASAGTVRGRTVRGRTVRGGRARP
ncbi:MAG TPA: hypothetical protein VFU36_11350 [Jatrophihabitans sp.]|nr:hypothetical protein [Jatrophihabitans sp.]